VRTSHDVFDEQVNAPNDLWIGLLPVKIIFPRQRREGEISRVQLDLTSNAFATL